VSRIEDIVTRDGPCCVWCGREVWPRDRTADHLLPRSRGGRGGYENLVLACRPCNRNRRSQAVASYVRAKLAAGAKPRMTALLEALDRLARSARREQRVYGERQRAALARV
jgi:5-methylcytosine-specific restriction endonuclease McrA